MEQVRAHGDVLAQGQWSMQGGAARGHCERLHGGWHGNELMAKTS